MDGHETAPFAGATPVLRSDVCCIAEIILQRPVKFAKVHNSEYEFGLDHMGGTRCCESNESLLYKT